MKSFIRRQIRSIPLLAYFARFGLRLVRKWRAFRPSDYWEARYAAGGNSGPGSYGRLAHFKAEVLNAFVKENGIKSVIELGCGDGAQLSLSEYPSYTGIDVSKTVLAQCRTRFANDSSKTFLLMEQDDGRKADLALSLDVIYHLTADAVFEQYMRRLTSASRRWLIVYSSNSKEPSGVEHVRHRRFTDWIAENAKHWRLIRSIPNRFPFTGDLNEGSDADFFIFEHSPGGVTA